MPAKAAAAAAAKAKAVPRRWGRPGEEGVQGGGG